MSTIVLTSAGHAPGVTTTALGLTLAWPRPAILVDADPHPSQSVLAGYLQGADPYGRGLWAMLAAHRERRPLNAALEAALLELPDAPERRFLPGFANPGMAELFAPVWPEFMTAIKGCASDVVVDAGRVSGRGLPPALLEAADAILVVTGSSLVDLVTLRIHLPGLVDAAPSQRLSLLVIGPGRPYTEGEIARQFEIPIEEPIAWAPRDARIWSHGDPANRRFRAGGHLRSIRKSAASLMARLEQRRVEIGVPR